MAKRGLGRHGAAGSQAGPAIVDLNTGYVRASGGSLLNMYDGEAPVQFSDAEYALYRDTITRIKNRIQQHFGLASLHFTAPTFITQLVGDGEWTPATVHDEYWHTHVDKNNTAHYDYSGLLYLTTHGVDFEGGEFDMHLGPRGDVTAANRTVLPRSGRLLAFTSGPEHPHRVRRVTAGTRYLVAMWFTCDERRRFSTFLDGRPHQTFAAAKAARQRKAADASPAERRRARRRAARRRQEAAATARARDEL